MQNSKKNTKKIDKLIILKEQMRNILNKKSSLINDCGKITVGLCVRQGLTNMNIPRSENKWQKDYEKDKEWIINEILKMFKSVKFRFGYPPLINDPIWINKVKYVPETQKIKVKVKNE